MLIGSVFDFILIFYSDHIKDFYGEEDDAAEATEDAKTVQNDTIPTIHDLNDLEMTPTKTIHNL